MQTCLCAGHCQGSFIRENGREIWSASRHSLGSWEWFASVRLARLVLGYQPGQPGHLSKSNSFSTSPAQLACIALDACCAVRVRATQEGA
eukprot:scaffold148587_cov18-Tisochrysis_lutea.AAC.1